MKKRLESKEGRSGRGSSQLNVSNLSKLLVMSEYALDTDNESVYMYEYLEGIQGGSELE